MTYVFKGHVEIVKIYIVKFNVSILNRLKIIFFLFFLFFLFFFANSKCIHKPNVIFNKTVTKLVTILTKCFFRYLNPTSYLTSQGGWVRVISCIYQGREWKEGRQGIVKHACLDVQNQSPYNIKTYSISMKLCLNTKSFVLILIYLFFICVFQQYI